MLANFIIKKKLVIGRIAKLEHQPEYWIIPVHVKANIFWNLLVADIRDVTAFITYVNRKKNKENSVTWQTVWVNPSVEDDSFISLHIGSKRDIGLLFKLGDTLSIYGQFASSSRNGDLELGGDYDILLELRSDNKILGCWKFQGAIVGGIVQEITPVDYQQLRKNRIKK